MLVGPKAADGKSEYCLHVFLQQGSNRLIETDSDLEDFEEFYDAPLDFMDSFERSMQISTEVILDGEDDESDDRRGNLQVSRVSALQKGELQNGLDGYHVSFDDLKGGEFYDIKSDLEQLDLQKSKYR